MRSVEGKGNSMTRLEHRVKKLEEKAPQQPCNHPLGILLNPTEGEAERLSKEMADCPHCCKRRDGDSP